MARKTKCKVCLARGAEIGPDGRCCGCRLSLLASRQGMSYGALVAMLHDGGVRLEGLNCDYLPPVTDNRPHNRFHV